MSHDGESIVKVVCWLLFIAFLAWVILSEDE